MLWDAPDYAPGRLFAKIESREETVGRFAQHTRLVASRGNADRLASKFLESVEIQQSNPACELMIVCRSPVDEEVVYLAEVWSSEHDWEEARNAPFINEWAKDMPSLVAEAPESVRLDPVGGKGLPKLGPRGLLPPNRSIPHSGIPMCLPVLDAVYDNTN